MPKTKKLTPGQRLYGEIETFCDLSGYTVADVCREATDDNGNPTARSVVTRWQLGQTNPTMVLADRVRAAMERLKERALAAS